jgi:heptose-I-phosphate ethanolaminephosphotransferase
MDFSKIRMRILLNWISEPLIDSYSHFIVLFVLHTLLGFIGLQLMSPESSTYALLSCTLGIMIFNFLSIYLVLFIGKILGKLGVVFRRIMICLFYFLLFANIICIVFSHQTINEDSINIIAGTNLSESTEFIHSFLNLQSAIYIFVLFVILVVVGYCLKKAVHLFSFWIQSIWNRTFVIICLVLSLIFASHYTMVSSPFYMSLPGIWHAISKYDYISEIQPSNPVLNTDSISDIPTIIVVIGESSSKFHHSLYGYDKETNPYSKVIPDSILHIFTNVESSGTHTIMAFYHFMTIAENDNLNYNLPNVIEIARKSGYKTSWISNQSERGMCDNKVSVFAHFCDTAVFNGNIVGGLKKKDLDGDLLPVLESFSKMDGKNLIFVHLMGSHGAFALRYPSEFERFKANDYMNCLENQRDNLAAYDNSILYSDYVVTKTFELFSKRDAVMFYFSDHGLDAYYTTSDYCGHAIPGDQKSIYYGKQIPFMTFTTAEFRKKHQSQLQLIDKSKDLELNTGDFPYMLMQVMGVTFADRANKYPFIKSDLSSDEHTIPE